MNELILSKIAEFTEYIPTAVGSDLEDLKPYTLEAEHWLKNELIGFPLYYKIVSISANPVESTFDGTFDYTFDESIPPEDIVKAAKLVICLHAYLSAIPFLDVVQTPNGFAVVNNQNVAPASKDRVDRLIGSVEKRLTAAIDSLIQFAFSYSQFRELWAKEDLLFEKHTEIVFITTKELMYHSGNKSASYTDLFSSHPLILSLQETLEKHISADYLNELLSKRRTAGWTAADKKVFPGVQTIIGLYLQKKDPYKLIEKLVNLMIKNPEDYPTYLKSEEYRLKISSKYENKKLDSTFFFGG